MRWFRRLKRLVCGDDRFGLLFRYATEQLGYRVSFDDGYLDTVPGSHDGLTRLARVEGACLFGTKKIVLSLYTKPEDLIFTLMHEIGHAIDFANDRRLKRWNAVWVAGRRRGGFTPDDREFILDIEEKAYEFGKEAADRLGVDVNEKRWSAHVVKMMRANNAVYSKPPSVV